MENFWWKLRYRWISFIGNWFSCLETEINSFSQSGSNLFMNKPINNLIVSVRLKFFQNASYLTLPPNGSLVLRKILCIHLRQKLVWQTCFSARSVCRKLSYEGYDGKKNRQIRENAIPHTSPKRNPLEGIIWGLCRTKVRLRANTMGWRQAHSDLIWIQGCTSDRQRSNVERAGSLIRKMFFLNKAFADCNCISDVYEPKNVFPNPEELLAPQVL